MKRIGGVVFVLILIFIFGVWFWGTPKGDLRLAFWDEGSLSLLSVFPERRQVLEFQLPGELLVWVPDNYGWYRLDKVEKLLKQEGREDLLGPVVFFNFGFYPSRVILGNSGQVGLPLVFGKWTDLKLWRWWWQARSLVRKVWKSADLGSLVGEEGRLNETRWEELIMGGWRLDFDDGVGDQALRLGVYNASGQPGWAGWLGKRMSWAGWQVVDVGDSEGRGEGKCLVEHSLNNRERGTMKAMEDWAAFLGCSLRQVEAGGAGVDLRLLWQVGAGFWK